MKAAVFPGVGQPSEIREVDIAGPGPGEVKVRIKATGVCHSDLSLRNGNLPHPFPCVAGHEGAGDIVAVGPGVTSVGEGDRVIIAWAPCCGACEACVTGEANLCSNARALSTGPKLSMDGTALATGIAGTFAEELVINEHGVVKIDDDVPYDVASLVGCGVMTGIGAAMNTAKVKPGSTVAVFGCGGVGINVIQGARLCGAAEIVAVDLLPEKREMAMAFGATHGCSPDELRDLAGQITGRGGFDYAFEVIGLPQTIRATYDAVRRGGTATIVGMGRMDKNIEFNAFELFYMEKKLLGSFYGSADVRTDFNRVLRLWKAGRIDLEGLITRRDSLEGLDEAFRAMEAGEVIRTVLEL
ncbi:MAG: Zn-dependent alcohol dehydrogenase [Acidimicrobiales bacterium]